MDTDRFQRRGFVPPPKSTTVFVLPGEPIDAAISRWTKGCHRAGIFNDFRRHEYYLSPGQRRRNKSMAERRRAAKYASS